MPLTDVWKKELARSYRVHYTISRNRHCRARDPKNAKTYRKCGGRKLRPKKRDLTA